MFFAYISVCDNVIRAFRSAMSYNTQTEGWISVCSITEIATPTRSITICYQSKWTSGLVYYWDVSSYRPAISGLWSKMTKLINVVISLMTLMFWSIAQNYQWGSNIEEESYIHTMYFSSVDFILSSWHVVDMLACTLGTSCTDSLETGAIWYRCKGVRMFFCFNERAVFTTMKTIV